jgi:hypothetical protein
MVLVAGLVAGLMAGWSSGCSRWGSANVDVKKAREAFNKRRGDYGEIPGKKSRLKPEAPVHH